MFKSPIVLAIAGTMSVPAAAQTAPSPTTAAEPQAKPQMVKKRVCEDAAEEAFSRVKSRICKTVMVPAQPSTADNRQPPAQHPNSGR